MLCGGESTDDIVFATTNTDGTTTYEWTNDNTDIGLAANGVGDIPSFTVTNDTTSALIATIEVTPTYENNGVICSGNQRPLPLRLILAQVEAVIARCYVLENQLMILYLQQRIQTAQLLTSGPTIRILAWLQMSWRHSFIYRDKRPQVH